MFRPEIIDLTKMSEMTNQERLQHAFDAAQRKFGIEPLLDAEDVDVEKPDEKSVITYVSSLYDVFPKVSVITILSKITICKKYSVIHYSVRNTLFFKKTKSDTNPKKAEMVPKCVPHVKHKSNLITRRV